MNDSMFEGSVFIFGYQNEVLISDLKIELPKLLSDKLF